MLPCSELHVPEYCLVLGESGEEQCNKGTSGVFEVRSKPSAVRLLESYFVHIVPDPRIMLVGRVKTSVAAEARLGVGKRVALIRVLCARCNGQCEQCHKRQAQHVFTQMRGGKFGLLAPLQIAEAV